MNRWTQQPRRGASDGVLLGEVARTLGISRTTAWTRCLSGDIPAEFVGGRYVVSRRTLSRLVAERERAAQAEHAAPAA